MGKILKILLFLLMLTSCSTNNDSSIHKYEYSDVEDKMISYLDVFNVKQDYYYLYYFQRDCYHCHGIKSKVISFSLNTKYGFYFIEVEKDYGFLSRTKEDTIGVNEPLKAFALMTPQLSIVEGGHIKETYIGQDEILNLIE